MVVGAKGVNGAPAVESAGPLLAAVCPAQKNVCAMKKVVNMTALGDAHGDFAFLLHSLWHTDNV